MAGLGRGFDVLIPKEFDGSFLVSNEERVQKLSISTVIPNPEQPRRNFDEKNISELAESIKQYGVLQPLIVSPQKNGEYRIVAGERRWRASKLAGLKDVPAIVRERQELEELEVALVENVQRVDLSPMEQAVSIEKLHQQFNMTYKQIAARLGKAEATVSNIVRLLGLPGDAAAALGEGKITEGHARSILALKEDPGKQTVLLQHIINDGWTVRQAEQYVTSSRAGLKTETAVKKRMERQTPETKAISGILRAPVSVKRMAKGGRLEIGFKTDEEFDRIVGVLRGIQG